MVGSRRAAAASLDLAHELSYLLSLRGIGVVSGLALGVDAAAHGGCLGGPAPTVAVPGSGLRRIHPRENRPLAEAIMASGGALVSELGPDRPVSPGALVRRNHTICALARAVVVAESGACGGTMHAARFAIDLGRPLWVPRAGSGEGGRLLLEAGAERLREASPQMRGLRAEGGPFARGFDDARKLAAELAAFVVG